MEISPEIKDIGTHNVRLVAFSLDGQKYVQEVTIQVRFDKESAEFSKYPEVKAKIISISRTGIVNIQFNQAMIPLGNISAINPNTTNLMINSTYRKN